MADGIDHKARGHARFGASSAARWFACPGSVRLCDMVEKRAAGAAADEGTRAHELLEVLLRCSAECRSDEAHEYLGAASQEMKDAVMVAFFYIQDLLADYPDAVMLVEHPFEISVAAAPGEVWGTCDVVIFVPSLRLLYVIDYKHGAGVYVDVRGNKQLRFYGLGALIATDMMPELNDVQADTVALVIIQPRCPFGDPVREEWLPVEDLLEFGKEIGAAVEAAKAPDAPLVPGEEQCRFCAAKLSCPARESQAVAVTGVAFADVKTIALPVAGDVTDEKIAEVQAAKVLVLDWFAACENELVRRLGEGRQIAGWKLVEAQPRRQWVDDDPVRTADALADVVRPNGSMDAELSAAFKVEKLLGLGEIEALLKKGVDKVEARRRLDAMAFLTTKKSSGKLTIAPESDPRPAASKVADAFAGVQLVEVR